jgi:hypothetical protein
MATPIRSRRHLHVASTLLQGLVLCSLGTNLTAQSPCYGFGSIPTAATWQAGPSLQSCPFAPDWPTWRLFTPGHREPAPHPGFNPGNAWSLPRVIVTYRCTGFLLVPIVPDHIRTMGYVIDQPEVPCAPAGITS